MDDVGHDRCTGAVRSFCAGSDLATVRDGATLTVRRGAAVLATFPLTVDADGAPLLDAVGLADPAWLEALLAALETLFVTTPALERVRLTLVPGSRAERACLEAGLAVPAQDGLSVPAELFWQHGELCLARPRRTSFPQMHIVRDGRRHPLRPPQPRGPVYARFIPWLGQVLSFRAVDPQQDLDRFHRWMNDPRVDRIWSEAGDLDTHRAYLDRLMADPHMLPLIGSFDDRPFGYFELYWAKENRLGPHYDAHDYDRGWHVLVGEDAFRGRPWVSAWLPSLMHYMFLDDPRTQRIVGEPAASHAQQIRNLDRSGFAKVKHVAFPHKRALLVTLGRERFFADRLWAPGHAGG